VIRYSIVTNRYAGENTSGTAIAHVDSQPAVDLKAGKRLKLINVTT